MGTPKVPTKRVASDDCEITVDGIRYPVHKGESVEVIPLASMQSFLSIVSLGDLNNAPDAAALEAETDPEKRKKLEAQITAQAHQMQDALNQICEELSRRVVKWDWTDLMGEPLPQPCGKPDVLKALTSEELFWLRSVTMGEASGERKNASKPSLALSTVKATSAGRSRRKQS